MVLSIFVPLILAVAPQRGLVVLVAPPRGMVVFQVQGLFLVAFLVFYCFTEFLMVVFKNVITELFTTIRAIHSFFIFISLCSFLGVASSSCSVCLVCSSSCVSYGCASIVFNLSLTGFSIISEVLLQCQQLVLLTFVVHYHGDHYHHSHQVYLPLSSPLMILYRFQKCLTQHESLFSNRTTRRSYT